MLQQSPIESYFSVISPSNCSRIKSKKREGLFLTFYKINITMREAREKSIRLPSFYLQQTTKQDSLKALPTANEPVSRNHNTIQPKPYNIYQQSHLPAQKVTPCHQMDSEQLGDSLFKIKNTQLSMATLEKYLSKELETRRSNQKLTKSNRMIKTMRKGFSKAEIKLESESKKLQRKTQTSELKAKIDFLKKIDRRYLNNTLDTHNNNIVSPQPKHKNSLLRVKKKKKTTQPVRRQYDINDFLESQTFLKFQSDNVNLAQELKQLRSESITILHQNVILYQMNGTQKKEMASLTKIMTCILGIFLAKKYSINFTTVVKVPRQACSLIGTSADLMPNDKLKLVDLFYAMMLPSGNDAAQSIANYFGRLIYRHSPDFETKLSEFKAYNKYSADQLSILSHRIVQQIKIQLSLQLFIKQMNNFVQYLKLQNTQFSNAHGLADINNKSCSNDLASLCYYSMKNQFFREIVKTRQYKCQIFNQNLKVKRQAKWINTNKLLQLQDCTGIKTGITHSAGPCMASAFKSNNFCPIIVILKTNTIWNRFKEVQFLYKWALQKFSELDLSDLDSP